MKKRLLIVSYFFWPEQTPRAFRAYELAREFHRRNFEVTIVTKKLNVDRQLREPFILHEFPIYKRNVDVYIPSKYLRQNGTSALPGKQPSTNPDSNEIIKLAIPSYLHFWKLFFWPSIWSREFANTGNQYLNNRLTSEFDLTISVDSFALPSHSLTHKLWKKGQRLGVVIGDSGDPFTFNPNHKFSFNHYIRERKLLACFDYITVPTSRAIGAFTKLGIQPNRIRVIPQGFSFDLAGINQFDMGPLSSDTTLLVYGGKFKPKIRNPENFLAALTLLRKQGKKVCCRIFTDLRDPYIRHLRATYEDLLSDSLQFNELIMRDEFLSVIQQADYSLNFVNRSKYQVPSKMIDFALTGAKVIDISMDMTPENIAAKILSHDCYTPELDSRFDIKNVVNDFISLKN
jgi:hypothetical protein